MIPNCRGVSPLMSLRQAPPRPGRRRKCDLDRSAGRGRCRRTYAYLGLSLPVTEQDSEIFPAAEIVAVKNKYGLAPTRYSTSRSM